MSEQANDNSIGNESAVTIIDGYALSTQFDDGEPRIRDIELAERLGYARSRDIRALIKGMIADGKLKDVAHCGAAPRERPGERAIEYWLTRKQALKVIAKSETAIADSILDEVIDVFDKWQRGELVSPRDAVISTLAAGFHNMTRIVASIEERSKLQDEIIRRQNERADQQDAFIRRQDERLTFIEGHVSRNGTITDGQLKELKRRVKNIAALECEAGRWTSSKAATTDIYNELKSSVGWGSKGQSWAMLPGALLHDVHVGLRNRETSILRELKITRQGELPFSTGPWGAS
jgi:hypothetical protein